MLQATTFLGEIQGGRILTDQPLAALVGLKVSVTVLDPTPAAAPGATQDPPEPESPFGPEEPVILDDLGRIDIPPRDITYLKARIVDVGRIPPRVYPSDLED